MLRIMCYVLLYILFDLSVHKQDTSANLANSSFAALRTRYLSVPCSSRGRHQNKLERRNRTQEMNTNWEERRKETWIEYSIGMPVT